MKAGGTILEWKTFKIAVLTSLLFPSFLLVCLLVGFVRLADTRPTHIDTNRSLEGNKISVHFLCNAQKSILLPETTTLLAEIFKLKHSLHK